jgi:hypothetical protein
MYASGNGGDAEANASLASCHGLDCGVEYAQIVRTNFDSNGICRIGKTVAAIAPHPVTRGLANEYWIALGRLLRNNVRNASGT